MEKRRCVQPTRAAFTSLRRRPRRRRGAGLVSTAPSKSVQFAAPRVDVTHSLPLERGLLMADTSTPAHVLTQRQSSTALPAFILGIPLAALVIYLVCWGPGKDTELERYLSHQVEKVEVILFCCAFAALAAKLWNSRRERAPFRMPILPAWDGQPVPVEEAPTLLAEIARLPYR